MHNLEFIRVTEPEYIAELANLADKIWREYFPAFVDQEKIDYLLDRMLSTEVLTRQIADEDYEFYFIDCGDDHVGFIGLTPHEKHLFLSKLYLVKSERGKGYSTQALAFIADRARIFGLDTIRLTCDRENKRSLEIYEHMGFEVVGPIDIDMGNGIEMNDYLLDWKFE